MSDHVLLISDFNIETLSRLLERRFEGTDRKVTLGPFGQAFELLHQLEHPCWQDNPSAALLWTSPGRVSQTFLQASRWEECDPTACDDEVDYYIQLIERVAKRVDTVFVPTFVGYPWWPRAGLLDWNHPMGSSRLLHRMNGILLERLGGREGVFVLDTQRWIDGGRGFDARGWHNAKMPFDATVYTLAADALQSALNAIRGRSKKIVITDLDNTMWGGIVGDDGWQNLKIGGHDPAGEAFHAYQRYLKALRNRGIVLAIVSKNEEATALEAIDNHPEMLLKREDFVGWRINWEDKAANIASLMKELNLGLDSAVFIDDNPVERTRVRGALPDVAVPDIPANPLRVPTAIAALGYFDAVAVSGDDRKRTEMYRARKERTSAREDVGSLDDWLTSLETTVSYEPINDGNVERTVQLFNKTNQMNLATRRLPGPELLSWVEAPNNHLWTFRVRDKFGDAGLTGIASVSHDPQTGRAEITDYLLSCRVMGRKVEETVVHVLVESARALGATEIVATFRETPKNQPCLRFWKMSGFEHDESANTFRWDGAKPYPLPESIALEGPED